MLTMKPPRDSSNIAEQLHYLREYKHAFLRSGILQILMSILVDPLEREGSSRSSQV
jgi:timeless